MTYSFSLQFYALSKLSVLNLTFVFVIRALPESDGRYHMKRCVDSGLWVPSKEDEKTSQEDGFVVKKDGEEVT